MPWVNGLQAHFLGPEFGYKPSLWWQYSGSTVKRKPTDLNCCLRANCGWEKASHLSFEKRNVSIGNNRRLWWRSRRGVPVHMEKCHLLSKNVGMARFTQSKELSRQVKKIHLLGQMMSLSIGKGQKVKLNLLMRANLSLIRFGLIEALLQVPVSFKIFYLSAKENHLSKSLLTKYTVSLMVMKKPLFFNVSVSFISESSEVSNKVIKSTKLAQPCLIYKSKFHERSYEI